MAFPFIFEANFEQGDASEWDSETDTAAQLDFPHYTELARFPWRGAVPYRGANCLRLTLSGGTSDAFVSEGDINIAAAGTAFFRFSVYFSPTFTGTADDTFHLFELQGAANAIQAVLGARIVAATDIINLGIGELAPTSFSPLAIERGVWYTVELDVTIDDGVGNNGTIDVFITKDGAPAQLAVSAAQVASLDQIAVTHGVLGVQNHLATTTGVILIDEFANDDARLFPLPRYPRSRIFTKTGHMFVGPGWIDFAGLLTTGGSEVVQLWDTDRADINIQQGAKIELTDAVVEQFQDVAFFEHGCFVTLAGTDPRAVVNLVVNKDERGVFGPLYYSDNGLHRWAENRS